MRMGEIDMDVSRRLQRLEQESERMKAVQEKETNVNLSLDSLASTSSSSQPSVISEPDMTYGHLFTMGQNRFKMEKLAQAADRFNVGNYAISELVNAALRDMNLVKEEYMLTPKKVCRARELMRRDSQIKSQDTHAGTLVALYFDGRKDRRTFFVDQGGSSGFTVEEHVVLLKEPNSQYLMHITPEAGTGRALANGIWYIPRQWLIGLCVLVKCYKYL